MHQQFVNAVNQLGIDSKSFLSDGICIAWNLRAYLLNQPAVKGTIAEHYVLLLLCATVLSHMLCT